jgi:hypothetical protein
LYACGHSRLAGGHPESWGLSLGGGADLTQSASFYQRVTDQVATLPRVRDVGLTTYVPMGEGDARGSSLFIDGKLTPDKALQ